MKRKGGFFNKIVNLNNIRLAIVKAARHKSNRPEIQECLKDIDKTALSIRELLISGRFSTSDYKTRVIHDPKERKIFILPFYPDRIVQHAIMNILEPFWYKQLIPNTFACIKKRGQQAASLKCHQFLVKNKYILKCDISKYYKSINHQLLKNLLRRKIKDAKLLALLDNIIDSLKTETNIPVGNYISQWFGNMFLAQVDDLVVHKLGIKAYVRYCDDFILFSDDKNYLKYCANEIKNFINTNMNLTLSKCQLINKSQGVDFLGYRHFPDKILLRKRTVKRLKKRLNVNKPKRVAKMSFERARGQVAAALGWTKHADTYNLRKLLNLDYLVYLYIRAEPLGNKIGTGKNT